MSWHAGGGGAATGGRGERISGRVKDWNAEKGFGFIHTLDADYFCHHSAVQGEGFKSLRDNEEVEFEVETNPANGKLQVVNLSGPGGAPVKGGGDRPAGKGRGRGGGKGKSEDGTEWSGADRPGGRGRGGAKGGQRQGPKPNSVFVAGLSWATTDEGFREHFEQVGEVADAYIVKDRETGKSRGFGKVAFATAAEQERAIEALHESDLDGRTITVREDNPPPPKDGGTAGWSPAGASTSWSHGAGDSAAGSTGVTAGGGWGSSSWASSSWPAAAPAAAEAGAASSEERRAEEESPEAAEAAAHGDRAVPREDASGESEDAPADSSAGKGPAPASSPSVADGGGEVSSSVPDAGASGWSSGDWSAGWSGTGGWGSSGWAAQGGSWSGAWGASSGAEGADGAGQAVDTDAGGSTAQS